MDKSRFGDRSPGELVSIPVAGGSDWAFVPTPLPPDWRIPEAVWRNVSEARHAIGLMEGMGRILPNPRLVLWHVEDREAIESSRIEGTVADPREILAAETMREGAATAEVREVRNCELAMRHALDSRLPLSLRLIREIHGVLMRGDPRHDATSGKFRTVQVALGNTRRFVPPPPDRVDDCLDRLERFWHAPGPSGTGGPGRFDPLIDCFLTHYQFEAIHPFADGNGRVGRILLTLMLKQRLGMEHAWLGMSPFFSKNREEYVDRLFRVSSDGEWTEWITFCLVGVVETATQTALRCDRLRALQQEFRARIPAQRGTVRLTQVIDDLFIQPTITAPEIARKFHVTFNTAQSDLRRLKELHIVDELSGRYPTTYFSPTILEIAYGELESPNPATT